MINVYSSNTIEGNEFYILNFGNGISEIVVGEEIRERALKEDGDSTWIVDGPLYEKDLRKIIHSSAGVA